jgi:uncharacterized protein YjbI with pentapeptide repeats
MTKKLPWFYWAIDGTVLVALILLLVYWGNQVWLDWTTLQQTPTDASKKKFDASLEIAKAIVGGIGTIATIAGGGILFLNFRVANRNAEIANKNVELTESRLITERFSKAIEQIGSDNKIEVRLGGIYALERIAYDSERDHWTIMEVLTSFIQERSPNKPIPEDEIRAKAYEMWQKNRDGATDEARWIAAEIELAKERVTKDIQAALTVIGRRHEKDPPDKRLNLSGTNISGTNLSGANLQGADLSGANLQGATLWQANLQEASLSGANLQGADLSGANLQGANLRGANLQEAFLGQANLQGANLSEANLQEAFLGQANLQGANLSEANLQEAALWCANLQGANFGGANLQGADLEQANLQEAALGQANLQGAVLLGTDLHQAQALTKEQLEGKDSPLLCNVALPDGFPDINKLKDRDCDRLPLVLHKRNPQLYGTPDQAKEYVNKARQKPFE